VEFSTLPRLVGPIEVKFDCRRRAGFDVQEFNGWPIAVINNHFMELYEKGDFDVHTKIKWRRALLCSYEVTCIANRERFNV
jgi:hypothetical protein